MTCVSLLFVVCEYLWPINRQQLDLLQLPQTPEQHLVERCTHRILLALSFKLLSYVNVLKHTPRVCRC